MDGSVLGKGLGRCDGPLVFSLFILRWRLQVVLSEAVIETRNESLMIPIPCD
jgi:hypothetical protein